MSKLEKLKCWWKHDWQHLQGRWVIPDVASITEQQCKRCGLYKEVEHIHPIGISILTKQEYRITNG